MLTDMLRLADTSIRLYRKKNGRVSFRLRSYLMVDTDVGFKLSAYLKDISCHLTLNSGRIIDFQDVSYSDSVLCKFENNTMVHDFWAHGVGNMPVIKNGIAALRVDYRISFTGH